MSLGGQDGDDTMECGAGEEDAAYADPGNDVATDCEATTHNARLNFR